MPTVAEKETKAGERRAGHLVGYGKKKLASAPPKL
jgi:hypothetical protein